MPDLNYFALDWGQAAEVLGAVVLLAVFIERSLALLFENEWYRKRFAHRHTKEAIAFCVALVLCIVFKFDAVGIIMKQRDWSAIGLALTAGVVAGGSKASIKLFVDIMNIQNLTEREKEAMRASRARGGAGPEAVNHNPVKTNGTVTPPAEPLGRSDGQP